MYIVYDNFKITVVQSMVHVIFITHAYFILIVAFWIQQANFFVSTISSKTCSCRNGIRNLSF